MRKMPTPADAGYPYTGALAVILHDMPGTPIEVISAFIAELLAHFGPDFLSQLDFNLDAHPETGPSMSVDGPPNIIDRLFGYAGENYPRIAAEYEQI